MFNALKFSKELEEAGFTKEQAEATINTFYKFMENDFATKGYIKDAIKEALDPVKTEMSEVRTEVHELRYKIDAQTDKMTIKLGSLVIGATIIILGCMKFWLP